MKEFKGTKGEWKREGTIIFVPGGGFDVRYMPDAEENAKLIAAAPDLLEALQKVIAASGSITDLILAVRASESAIAKALGETK